MFIVDGFRVNEITADWLDAFSLDARIDLKGPPLEKSLGELYEIYVFEHAPKLRREPVEELFLCPFALIGGKVDPLLRDSLPECLTQRGLGREEAAEAEGHCASEKVGHPAERVSRGTLARAVARSAILAQA